MRVLVCLLLSMALPTMQIAADERGRDALAAEYAASHGYGDVSAVIEMNLVSKKGNTTERALRLKQLESEGTIKTIIVFDEPKPIRGTGLLTFSNHLADDDQWLYLPSIKRVKKISSRDRSGPFVGSEFAYEDLADYAIDEFEYEWLREESCGELVCDVVKRTPKDKYSGYSFQHVWIDQPHSRVRMVNYFDEYGDFLKTMKASDFRAYQVGERTFLQPHVMKMVNAQTSRSTTLHWKSYEYAKGLTETRDFTTNALRRLR